MDSVSSPSWREHANPALRTICANLRCSSQRGGVLGLPAATAAEALVPPRLLPDLERLFFVGGGGVDEEDGREISLNIPPKVCARVRT